MYTTMQLCFHPAPLHAQAKQQHKQREEELLRQKEAAVERGEAIKQRRLQEEAEREAAALHAWQVSVAGGCAGRQAGRREACANFKS
jgi:hypothetical protein